MKPEGAQELPVDADLCVTSAEDALQILGMDVERMTRRNSKEYHPARITIKVASQTYSAAVQVSERLWVPERCYVSIELSMDYEPDEWSIHYWRILSADIDHVETKEDCVWSPGA